MSLVSDSSRPNAIPIHPQTEAISFRSIVTSVSNSLSTVAHVVWDTGKAIQALVPEVDFKPDAVSPDDMLRMVGGAPEYFECDALSDKSIAFCRRMGEDFPEFLPLIKSLEPLQALVNKAVDLGATYGGVSTFSRAFCTEERAIYLPRPRLMSADLFKLIFELVNATRMDTLMKIFEDARQFARSNPGVVSSDTFNHKHTICQKLSKQSIATETKTRLKTHQVFQACFPQDSASSNWTYSTYLLANSDLGASLNTLIKAGFKEASSRISESDLNNPKVKDKHYKHLVESTCNEIIHFQDGHKMSTVDLYAIQLQDAMLEEVA